MWVILDAFCIMFAKEELQNETRRLANELGREQQERVAAVRGEAAAREAMQRELSAQMRRLAVDGIRLEVVGWAWLTAGLILTTWPQELSSVHILGACIEESTRVGIAFWH